MAEKIDLTTPRRVHVIGAGGAGMGAIASVLESMGHEVTGSDLKEGPVTQRLRAEGIGVAIGHDAANVSGVDLVAISTAIPDRNPEVQAAQAAGIPVLRRRDILPAIAATRRTIAVAGTHGKTTTSSMLALVLVEADLRPSFIIGGDVNEIGSGATWDEGEWFVIEADESDRTFLALDPEVAVVTSIEPDHLEEYGHDQGRLTQAFEEFAAKARTRIVSADDQGAAGLADRDSSLSYALTYGTNEDADYRMVDLDRGRSSVGFTIRHDGEDVGRIELPVPGLHNARNAAAAAVAGSVVGASFEDAARALARFGGVARRFEFRGRRDGITFVDDYAHLPTEVEAAIGAARDGDWDRIVCVFQPHRYSRTAAVGRDFGQSFLGADIVAVTDIYASGETPRPGVTGKIVADAVSAGDPGRHVEWLPRLEDVVSWLLETLQPGDLCLTLGAGDLTSVPDAVIDRIEPGSREPS
jgi:UDP-N-acetylmuramate--alanine ligase